MRVIKKLYIGDKPYLIEDIDVLLELNSAGRGFVSIKSSENLENKEVKFSCGYKNLVVLWFTGYVERMQVSDNGMQRLFIRESCGVLADKWPLSFQHPTLQDVTKKLTELTQLQFKLSHADYTNKPIPHLKHFGTGYQLLANLGRLFNIDDYIWHPMPDGQVFIGSHSELFFAKEITIPQQITSSTASSNTITLPLVQSIRPGVIANGQRVQSVRLKNDEITLTFQEKNKAVLERQLERFYPEFASKMHLPQLAVVVEASDKANRGISDPFRPYYAVDVQMLDEYGKPDHSIPIYRAVPLPVYFCGNESGLFQYPQLGTVVEVAFHLGQQDKPFIRSFYPTNQLLPEVAQGEQLQQQRHEVQQRITASGSIIRTTDQTLQDKSISRDITADDEVRNLVSRSTTIKATDTKIVYGCMRVRAGAMMNICAGDYTIATSNNYVAYIGENSTTHIAKDNSLTIGGNNTLVVTGNSKIDSNKTIETVKTIKKSIAGIKQAIIAPSIWLGSSTINVSQLMLDTLKLIEDLADLTAAHTHYQTGTPENAAAIKDVGARAVNLDSKYSPVIEK